MFCHQQNERDVALETHNDQEPAREVLKRDGVIPARNSQARTKLIDLSEYYTASLDDDWLVTAGANLQPLPKGIQTFAGTAFDVRGVIQLAGTLLYEESEMDEAEKKAYYPRAVKGIRVQQKGDRIYFLHAASWWADANEKIGEYVIHYASGDIKTVPILYLHSLRDWWTTPGDPLPKYAETAWKGQNEATKKVGSNIVLFKYTWENPLPEIRIRTIDFISAETAASPYLIAITID